ncbi:MAG: sulfurtransferase TusA family protein [Planctomycetes bacterium]|nr:sulfurtransferase TusA family protein [Planctomycetota bacterium]MBL7044759.1 sulfurtransferase TusA family protein [Pirellulaceae bacterium]
MADKSVDARGLSCPEPVLLTKQAIESIDSGTIEVMVDTVTSRENITRMAETLSCTVQAAESDKGGFVLNIKKG